MPYVVAAKACNINVAHRLNGVAALLLKKRGGTEVTGEKNGKILVSAVGKLNKARRPTFTYGKDMFASLSLKGEVAARF